MNVSNNCIMPSIKGAETKTDLIMWEKIRSMINTSIISRGRNKQGRLVGSIPSASTVFRHIKEARGPIGNN